MSELSYKETFFQQSIFNFYQACENLFYAIRLVFTLENNKQHNLAKLLDFARKYSTKFIEIFPCQTAEEKRLFNLVKAAYVEARYNPQFVVTKDDIDALMPKINELFELVNEICEARIKGYEDME